MPQAFPLLRSTVPLKGRVFDLLVIGGGIYGAWTAYDAALRGLSVALIEKDDWASGTSSSSSKLIHGGLRYLEHYDFKLVRESLAERRQLHQLAPHLVRPLDFLMPVWKGPRASMFLLSCGLFLYDLLGLPNQPVAWHRHYSARALLREFPYIDPLRLLGGFRYGDCQQDDARMTLAVVAAAQGAGAVTANRIQAEVLLEQSGTIHGARVLDRASDERFELRARIVVNAAGPWAPGLLGEAAPRVKRIKGIHLVLPAISNNTPAFLLTAQDGRVIFVIPWYGRTLVGTTEAEISDPDCAAVTSDEVRYLLAGVKNGLPGISWGEGDVIAHYAGIRTLQAEDKESLSAVTREFVIHEPKSGLLLPLGGKFTTARRDAAEIVDAIQHGLGMARTPNRTARKPLPGTPQSDGSFERWQAQTMAQLRQQNVDEECAKWLTLRHGIGVNRVSELLRENPAWAQRLHPDAPFLRAEAILAVRDEMALSLDDVIRRRVPVKLIARLDHDWLRECAGLLAPELGCDVETLL